MIVTSGLGVIRGIQWVENKDAAGLPTVHRAAATTGTTGPKRQQYKAEKPTLLPHS